MMGEEGRLAFEITNCNVKGALGSGHGYYRRGSSVTTRWVTPRPLSITTRWVTPRPLSITTSGPPLELETLTRSEIAG
jgi:hypothetical protein